MATAINSTASALPVVGPDESSVNALSGRVDEDMVDSEYILCQDWGTIKCDSGGEAGVGGNCDRSSPGDMLLAHHLEDIEHASRNLRPQQSTKRFRDPCYDLDDSGDYDPAVQERLHRQRQRRIRAKTRLTEYSAGDQVCYGERGLDELATETEHLRSHGDQYPQDTEKPKIVLHVKSEQGKRKLKGLVLSSTKVIDLDVKGYALRRRALGEPGQNTADITVRSERNDLFGHPIARGCHECAELHDECSLLHDETTWPCSHCRIEGNDCRLITLPLRLKACKPCGGRREPCSYTYTRNHGASCQQCAAVGIPCVAGPAKDFIRSRIRYPAPEEHPDTQDYTAKGLSPSLQLLKKAHNSKRRRKPPEDCLECSESSESCRYQLDNTEQYSTGCMRCQDNGLSCTIREKLPMALVNDSPQTEVQAPWIGGLSGEEAEVAQSKENPPERPSRTQLNASIRKIETSFTYPILFDCDNAAQSGTGQGCLFCASPEAAILGFGLRETQIVDHRDNRLCREVPTRMNPTSICTMCTTSRLGVLACEKHDIRPIIGVYNCERIGAKFDEDLDVRCVKQLEDLCTICPLRAVYECAAEPSSMERGAGCGLKLCETCALTMEMEHGGDLRHTLASLPSRVGEMLQLRADCELLREDGAMERHLERLSIILLATNNSF
ncbi:hypothetical protein CERZMDRAFT_94996 [Cercospora zeae-maydis SCOH1-5]|uniref:Zn(2)-C6 fungal-type domain-containing protein n=1 Tax=Cercospora zeae-maydis SCOH1-5 TaxID=717836 RepID=A0A6A6FMG7_9PEZI|nr:hypothetical protein CERZMDRAFT_94996 [Cercospora zeae-maydis SCOH1-5]